MTARPAATAPVVVPFDPEHPPAALDALAPAAVLERWRSADRSHHGPRIVAAPDGAGTGWAGAALVTARPGTAYGKIVDAVGDVPAAVDAVLAHARERGLVQVKWEGWTVGAAQAAAAGFAPMGPPRGDARDARHPAAGHVHWVAGGTAEPPYYRQTTDFSCGAVTALVARAAAGAVEPGALDREAELTLWRAATNFPACEPVGLGTAVRRAWPDAAVTVHLDGGEPVLLDTYSGAEREWRAVLQRASRADAERAGVPVDPRRPSPADLRGAVGRGEHVLLLVSLVAMQGFDVPHWVLCHGAVPGALVIEDPWTGAAAGDTWVDAHLLPVPDASLDAMWAVEGRGRRGAVRIGRP
ncbi:Peptidase_C39 like family protein [Nocardiopsis flavescens]|uniref:Peptidase_C39 like family protein n=1 Tax=Nocardiopsis flavescens TaxID=758803 RepID=A0A1M6CLW5_9ACTN|nr:peptidase C39 family protein [Nocardiopsis flavescens]SHI62032.1 Peptidase_C39 like family protein [Nocardiopsis flavescens]